MRGWKSSILLFVGLGILVVSAVTVSAVTVTDPIDDVYDGTLETFGSRPNIDITTVTYELSGDTVTLTITVNGNIVDSEYILYTIFTNGTSLSGYVAQYQNGNGYVLKDTTIIDSEVLVSHGNTIIFTFTRSDLIGIGEIWGSAMENSEDYSQGWMDYAPNSFSPYYSGDDDDDTGDDDDDTGDDDDDDVIISPNGDDTGGDGNGGNGGGIPGFEAITVIAAIAVALIILRRKK